MFSWPSDTIELEANSIIAKAYGRGRIEEGYHYNYGIAENFAEQLSQSELRATAWDERGDIRVVELCAHSFFVSTLFQHECNALKDKPAPLVEALLIAAQR